MNFNLINLVLIRSYAMITTFSTFWIMLCIEKHKSWKITNEIRLSLRVSLIVTSRLGTLDDLLASRAQMLKMLEAYFAWNFFSSIGAWKNLCASLFDDILSCLKCLKCTQYETLKNEKFLIKNELFTVSMVICYLKFLLYLVAKHIRKFKYVFQLKISFTK